jgi:hypothetical protein
MSEITDPPIIAYEAIDIQLMICQPSFHLDKAKGF